MLADEIKSFFHGDVATDDASLAAASRDYSLFKVMPQVVVFPKDVEDLENLVKFVAKKKAAGENISLTGRSAGTDMTGGPLSQSIIVSFTKYFNHIEEIYFPPLSGGRLGGVETPTNSPLEEGEKPYATVESGVYFRDLEKELTSKGLLYPAYPASKDLCAIGGMVNNNSGGEKTLAYGKTEDYVRELKVVMSDGEEHIIRPLSGAELTAKLAEQGFEGDMYRKVHELIELHYDAIKKAKPDVSKNSAGYYLWNVWNKEKDVFDLTKLWVGSQGTLGLLTEAKLGLVPAKKYSRLAVIFLQDLKWVGELVIELLKLKPESIESYDDRTLEVAVKFWPQVLGSMKGNVVKLAWQFLPEIGMVILNGMPKMVMLVEMTDNDETELAKKLESLRGAVNAFAKAHAEPFAKTGAGIEVRVLRNALEAEKYWTIRRQSFALLHGNSIGKDTAPFIDDFIVKPEYMPEVLPKVNAILDKYKNDLIYTITGHPGNGNFHIIPLMNLKDDRVRALIPKIAEEVYRLVFQYHGSITAEHNDGLIRTPYLDEMYGPEIVALFAEVKNIFDPQNIFNPGKKVNGDLKYSVGHIAATQ